MNKSILKRYTELRRKGWHAKNAWYTAKIEHEFNSRDDVRLQIIPDEVSDLDDLMGDTFNPEVNPDIQPARLEREKAEFVDRVNFDGVWGIVGQYHCPCCGQWLQAESVWGFVGDDWKESGYDSDIMSMTLDALKKAEAKVA